MTVNVGDIFLSKKHKKGMCFKIDTKNKDFKYFFKFLDGTLVWLSDKDVKSDLTPYRVK